jgi:hypothetical protein
VSVADEEAAMLLAAAFGPSPGDPLPPGAPDRPTAATTSGKPARAVTDELSLDDVFRDSAGRGTGSKSGAYSFDQFFSPGSAPTEGGGSPRGGGGSASEEGAPEGDLEQFTAWLEGLKRK